MHIVTHNPQGKIHVVTPVLARPFANLQEMQGYTHELLAKPEIVNHPVLIVYHEHPFNRSFSPTRSAVNKENRALSRSLPKGATIAYSIFEKVHSQKIQGERHESNTGYFVQARPNETGTKSVRTSYSKIRQVAGDAQQRRLGTEYEKSTIAWSNRKLQTLALLKAGVRDFPSTMVDGQEFTLRVCVDTIDFGCKAHQITVTPANGLDHFPDRHPFAIINDYFNATPAQGVVLVEPNVPYKPGVKEIELKIIVVDKQGKLKNAITTKWEEGRGYNVQTTLKPSGEQAQRELLEMLKRRNVCLHVAVAK